MSREDEICWYHSKITREQAENILLQESSEDGVFLVRDSNTSAGDFVLSVIYQRQVVHYQIRKHGEDAFFSIEENTTSHGLESLIEYYQESAHGLVTKLTKSCKSEPPPHNSRRHGRTNLLHRATKEGNYMVVSELVKSGYKLLEAKNQDGQTAVHLASLLGKDEILSKLIERGANVNCRDTLGYTPLHYACQSNLPSTVRLLILRGNANIQARNTSTGWVPLHEAASRGHIEVVKMLLSLNAPANPRTISNEMPWQLAKANDHLECADLLEKYESPMPKTHRSQWYHGTLGRNEAVLEIQKSGNKEGSFLIRFSDRNGGCFVLTMLHDQQIFHFLIRSEGKYLFIDDGPYLESLEHIIDYYCSIADGLPCILKDPILPRPKPPVPEFSTMPRCQKFIPKSNDKDDMHISAEFLELGDIIGEGEFGSVIRGIYQGQDVAVKTLRKEYSETNRDAFLLEAQVMLKLDHHCIVSSRLRYPSTNLSRS